MKDLDIKELDGGVGAEIHGVDLQKLSNSEFLPGNFHPLILKEFPK